MCSRGVNLREGQPAPPDKMLNFALKSDRLSDRIKSSGGSICIFLGRPPNIITFYIIFLF